MTHLLLAIIYIAFISLGLPDGLLGAAWPTMYSQLAVPVSYAGILSMIIAGGTIASSLASDWLTTKMGTGRLTLASVAMTAAALFGFASCGSFWQLCLWAIPYGLGAGSVDAALNNYVALHYASRHMSWLHCMWGIGASVGPYIMAYALGAQSGWPAGYRDVGILQVVLTAVLVFSLPLWKKQGSPAGEGADAPRRTAVSPLQVLRVPGAKAIMVTFFCYCALEQTTGLWAASYLVLHNGISAEAAAEYASLFYIGITAGRAVSGFVTMKLNDTQMVRLGQGIITAGIVALLLPFGDATALLGVVLVGLGCAPIYPCLLHATPVFFGADRSQAVMGMQMAAAYIGTCFMPPLYGIIAQNISPALFPAFLAIFLVLMVLMHETVTKRTSGGRAGEGLAGGAASSSS